MGFVSSRAIERAVILVGLVASVATACGEDAGPEIPAAADDGGAAPEGASEVDAAPPSDGASAEDAPVDAPTDGRKLSPTYTFKDVNHVLATGQSLSVGSQGMPPLSTAQPFANLTFVTGVMSGGTGLTSFIPLVEGDVIPGGAVPVETMSSAFANLVTQLSRDALLVDEPEGQRSHDLLVSAHGVGGTAYVGLKKGTAAYANGIAQATAGRDLAKAAAKSYVIRAVTTVHGESDHVAGNAAYEANLLEWQSDYEKDVKALTGQTEPVPLFQTQVSSWTKYGQATSLIPAAQLAAHVDAPGKVILVGPKYHLAYAPDGVHLSNAGYRHMGEDYAKAYRRVVLEGVAWEPVRPKQITRAGAVLTVVFHVPAPPLVLDTTAVKDPGAFGFEFTDAGPSTPKIKDVVVTGPDTVTITLTAAPVAANPRLRYAFTGTVNALGGPTTGPRGNLRDSDATPSRVGNKLYNWCVHFDVPVP